jgi:hypothetical protein
MALILVSLPFLAAAFFSFRQPAIGWRVFAVIVGIIGTVGLYLGSSAVVDYTWPVLARHSLRYNLLWLADEVAVLALAGGIYYVSWKACAQCKMDAKSIIVMFVLLWFAAVFLEFAVKDAGPLLRAVLAEYQ